MGSGNKSNKQKVKLVKKGVGRALHGGGYKKKTRVSTHVQSKDQY